MLHCWFLAVPECCMSTYLQTALVIVREQCESNVTRKQGPTEGQEYPFLSATLIVGERSVCIGLL